MMIDSALFGKSLTRVFQCLGPAPDRAN